MTTKKHSALFILTALSIFALPQIGIDLYLPSMPDIQKSLATTQFFTQLSITMYIFALGLTQLIYGPLSDRYGRKLVIMLGTSIFFLGSLVISMAQSIDVLLLGRLIQGVGMGSGFTVASAILADTFSGKMLAKMTTFSSMVYSSSPLLAPVLGGVFAEYFSWQVNFYFMAATSIVLLACIWCFIDETNTALDATALHLPKLLKNYLAMFKQLRFMALIFSLTMAFGITIAFNVIGPFLLQDILKVTPGTYGLLLFVLGAAYLLGTTINSKLVNHSGTMQLTLLGLCITILGCIAMFVSGLIGWFTVTSVVLWSSCIIFGTGFIWPNCFADALEVFSSNFGIATALIGAIGLIGTSLLSAVVSHFHINNEIKLSCVFLVIAIACLLSYLIAIKARAR